MSLLERVISVLAPHDCIVCGEEGGLLCASCSAQALPRLPERCYRCNRLSSGWKTCKSCRSKSPLRKALIRTEYAGAAKDLVYLLKFERAQAAAKPIAAAIAQLPIDTASIVMPVPTATSRRRQRGYDQAELIARQIAASNQLTLYKGLYRQGQTRQVGTKRRERHAQLADAFQVAKPSIVSAKTVLLVDDVLTTGATLETAARCLRDAGAAHVDAVVFAQA